MFLSVFFFRNSLQFKKVSLPLQPQTRNNGAIAQLVEQRTENPCVPGSIPGGTTHKKMENYYQGIDSANDDTFNLFRTFANNIKLVPYRTEWIVYDWEYKLAGTIDFVDYQNGEYTIYDWKRSDKIIASGMPIKINKYGEKGNYGSAEISGC